MKKIILKIKKNINKLNLINKVWVMFILSVLIILILSLVVNTKNTENTNELDIKKIMEAIKKVESEEPSRISENPTEEEVYNNVYVKSIRAELNSYLDGTNAGIEEYAIEKSKIGDNRVCGLDSFDKSYFKSKFIVINVSDADYGGLQADIFFVDKPDTLFWVWVYKLGEDGEYVLRGFCESSLQIYTDKPSFNSFIKKTIRESKYSL